MKFAGIAFAALLLASQSVRVSPQDHKSFLVGTYLGDEMRPDALYSGSGLHRTYYVRTDGGTWSLVSDPDPMVVMAHSLSPSHAKNGRPTTLDALKRFEEFAFRAEPDTRNGSLRNAFVVYVPRADDPKKEDRFDADFTPRDNPAHESANNVKAMCDARRFSPEQEKQYCANQ